MIEILKQGVPYDERWLKIECHRCLSTLKFQGKEAITGATLNYIICPICPDDNDNWLNVEKAKPI